MDILSQILVVLYLIVKDITECDCVDLPELTSIQLGDDAFMFSDSSSLVMRSECKRRR